MNNAMPIKTIIFIGIDKLLPMAVAFWYSFIIPDAFIMSLLKSLVIALIVKVLLYMGSSDIKRWSEKKRVKIEACKRRRKINKMKREK